MSLRARAATIGTGEGPPSQLPQSDTADVVEDDESLAEYFAACETSGASDSDLDVSTPSSWRASANSPLRGTVKRSRLVNLVPEFRDSPQATVRSRGSTSNTSTAANATMITRRIAKDVQLGQGWSASLAISRTAAPLLYERGYELVMNLLCAVGQRETPFYSLSTTSQPSTSAVSRSSILSWRPDTRARAVLEDVKRTALEIPLAGLQAELLLVASRCAALELQLASLDPSRLVEAHEAFVVENWQPSLPPDEPMNGAAALRRAAYMSLRAVCRLASEMIDAFRRSVLAYQIEVETEWLRLREGSSLLPPVHHHHKEDDDEEATTATATPAVAALNRWLLRNVMATSATVRKLWGPLSSLEAIFEECTRQGAPNHLHDGATNGSSSSSSASGGLVGPKTVENVCAAVINALTMVGGSMQTCRVDEHHSLVLMLLLCGCWPWVETLVWVASGSVPVIDESDWLAQAPSLFSVPLESRSSPQMSSIATATSSMPQVGRTLVSAISLVAGCEGIVRHAHWRAANAARHGALAEVLAVLEEATSPSSGALLNRRTPLCVRLGGDDVAVLRCNRHPLTFGVVHQIITDAANVDIKAVFSSCIHVDRSVPVSTWIAQFVLHPIEEVVQKTQRKFVAELLLKPLPPASLSSAAQLVGSPSSSPSHRSTLSSSAAGGGVDGEFVGGLSASPRPSACVTFVQSLDCVAKTALFVDWERMGETFIGQVARLPAGWWVTAPSLLTAAFSESCCSAGEPVAAFAQLRVAVLPRQPKPSAPITTASLLDLFQNAELFWDLPEQHRVILFPSLYYPASNSAAGGGSEADGTSSGSSGGVTPAFTKVFRLMAVLFLTHRLLLEHWKKNNSHGSAAASDCFTAPSCSSSSVIVYRPAAGGGKAHLLFVVQRILHFVVSEVHAAYTELRRVVEAERDCVANVCCAVDQCLALLEVLALQSSPGAAATSAAKQVHHCVVTIVKMSLDVVYAEQLGFPPLPVELVVSRCRSAVSQLLHALSSVPPSTMLRERLQPLVLQLSFNAYFLDLSSAGTGSAP